MWSIRKQFSVRPVILRASIHWGNLMSLKNVYCVLTTLSTLQVVDQKPKIFVFHRKSQRRVWLCCMLVPTTPLVWTPGLNSGRRSLTLWRWGCMLFHIQKDLCRPEVWSTVVNLLVHPKLSFLSSLSSFLHTVEKKPAGVLRHGLSGFCEWRHWPWCLGCALLHWAGP